MNPHRVAGDLDYSWAFHSYARGKIIDFSPYVINSAFHRPLPDFDIPYEASTDVVMDTVITTVTTEKLTAWPHSYSFGASALTAKYFLLYRVATRN